MVDTTTTNTTTGATVTGATVTLKVTVSCRVDELRLTLIVPSYPERTTAPPAGELQSQRSGSSKQILQGGSTVTALHHTRVFTCKLLTHTHTRVLYISHDNSQSDTRERCHSTAEDLQLTETQLLHLCVCVCVAGVLLHIMADTLGSVGVIISALLMQKYDLMIADPICSMLIALLIGVR